MGFGNWDLSTVRVSLWLLIYEAFIGLWAIENLDRKRKNVFDISNGSVVNQVGKKCCQIKFWYSPQL